MAEHALGAARGAADRVREMGRTTDVKGVRERLAASEEAEAAARARMEAQPRPWGERQERIREQLAGVGDPALERCARACACAPRHARTACLPHSLPCFDARRFLTSNKTLTLSSASSNSNLP